MLTDTQKEYLKIIKSIYNDENVTKREFEMFVYFRKNMFNKEFNFVPKKYKNN